MTPDFTCLLIPLAMAGLAILNAGLTRSRSTSHILLASLCAVSVAMLAFVIVGFSVAGNGRLFALSLDLTGIAGPLMLLMQLFSVGIAALIPVASGAERWRIAAVCASTALLAGLVYPLFAHWAASAGWLGALGFTDAGGAGSIQVLGVVGSPLTARRKN